MLTNAVHTVVGGGIDDLNDQRVAVPIRFVEMKRCAERLLTNEGATVNVRRTDKIEMTAKHDGKQRESRIG